jgi:hypothetical protein
LKNLTKFEIHSNLEEVVQILKSVLVSKFEIHSNLIMLRLKKEQKNQKK